MKNLKAVIELEVNCSEELIEKLGSMEAVAKQFQDQVAHELKLREYGKVKVTVTHLSDKNLKAEDVPKKRKRRTKAEMEEARRRGEA